MDLPPDVRAALAEYERHKQIEIGARFASGAFGDVHDADIVRGVSRQRVAVKLVDLRTLPAAALPTLVKEIDCLARLRSPYFVRFLGVLRHEHGIGIVMERMHEDLAHHIDTHAATMTLAQKFALALAMTAAVSMLHEQATPLVHRDIKPHNFLLDEHQRVKLSDFGFARTLEGLALTRALVAGSLGYMAPELLEATPTAGACSADSDAAAPVGEAAAITERVDVYSLGISLWTLFAGAFPFANRPARAVLCATLTGELPAMSDAVPAPVRDVLRACLALEPASRPSARTVLERLRALQSELGAR